MKTSFLLLAAVAACAGCGGPVAKFGELDRLRAAVLTDAAGLAPDGSPNARPAVQVTDPDRLAALETWLKRRGGRWQKASGPRPTRFQLQLVGDGQPLHTLYIDQGYLLVAEGKKLREMRLSNADSAELLACLGLPPDYIATAGGSGVDYGMPRRGIADGPPVGIAPAAATR